MGARVIPVGSGATLSLLSPGIVIACAGAMALFLLPSLAAGSESVVAAAIAADCTLVAPALAFAWLVRAGRAPWIVLLPIFAAGYAVAWVTLPTEHHAILDALRLGIAPVEIGVVTWIAFLARRSFLDSRTVEGDFATRFRAVARKTLSSRVPADILTTEVSILYHAFRWRKSLESSASAFSLHRKLGAEATLIGMIALLAVETPALHVLARQWSSLAAWGLTALSVYALVWLVGDFRALAARPLRLTSTHLVVRLGLRWEALIPRAEIERVERVAAGRATPGQDTLALASRSDVRLRLRRPVEVVGLYGMTRTVQELWLPVDEPERLCRELDARGT